MMNKIVRVVVVDDNEVVTSSIRKYFSSSELIKIVASFKNGKEALDYLTTNSNLYDLVVMDLILPQYDGIKILEVLKAKGIEKKIMVLSSFKDDYTVRQIQKLGADYYMLKPVDMEIMESRIMDMVSKTDEVKLVKTGKIESEVSTLLHDLGIPSHVRGYKYIRDGIMILYENDGIITFVTKEVYPKIADKYDTTPTRVERAIRHAIEISWIRGDIKLMESIFGNSVDFERSRPTNAEFLTAIADRFKLNTKDVVV